jgi:Holliday junction resolvasome RuvABC ATP-dependent DNA helicase subunit
LNGISTRDILHHTPITKPDDTLIDQIHKLNSAIRSLNSELEVFSPNFSVDLNHQKDKHSKSKKITIRDQYNFTLLKDGIHAVGNLEKAWLKKLASQVQDDCWGLGVRSAVGVSTTHCTPDTCK